MKRIFVLALALILAVGSLAVPSYAAETDSVPNAMINLLNDVDYDLYYGDIYKGTFIDPVKYVSGFSSYSWRFTVTSPPLSKYIIGIRCWTENFTLFAQFGNEGNRKYQCTFLGSQNGVQFFEVPYYKPEGFFALYFEFQNNYAGDLGLSFLFGVADNTVDITNVSYFANAMMYDNGDGEASSPDPDDFRWPVSVGSGNNVSLPVVVDFSGPTGSDFYSLDYGEVFLKIPFDSSFHQFDKITFLLFTCGEISSLGGRLESSDGSVFAGLPSELEYCGETQMVFDLEEQFERIHCYLVSFDVSGYDLSDLVLTLQLNIRSVFGSYIYQYDRGFYFQCSSIVGSYNIDETPWYAIFANWLKGQYASITNTISSGVSSITAGLTTIDTSVRNWLASVNQNLTNGFNRLASLLSPDADTDGFQDQVDDQGDRLDQMDDALNSVTKPALDRVDTNISGIVSDTDLANTAHVYTYIIDDNIMAPALTMVTILSMMSFALFGKR